MDFAERLKVMQQDRRNLAAGIDQALVNLHGLDGKIQLLNEILAEERKEVDDGAR